VFEQKYPTISEDTFGCETRIHQDSILKYLQITSFFGFFSTNRRFSSPAHNTQDFSPMG